MARDWGVFRMRYRIVAATVAAFTLSAPATAANLLDNGSFEEITGEEIPPGYQRGIAPVGWSPVIGFEVPDIINNSYVAANRPALNPFPQYATYLEAKDGVRFLDMNGLTEVGAIEQTVTGLTPGARVSLKYWAGSWAANSQGTLGASLRDGTTVINSRLDQFTPPVSEVAAAFTQFSLTGIVGSSGTVTVRFQGDSPASDRAAPALDLVSLAVVPEPATWLMLISGFGLVGSAMRRRAARTLRYA